MSCCNPRPPGSTRTKGTVRTAPKPTAKRTWWVTWIESGQVQEEEFTGGRSEELRAYRLSAQKRGSIRTSVTPVKPDPVASETTPSVTATPTDKAPAEAVKPVVKKTAAKKTTTKKAVAAK